MSETLYLENKSQARILLALFSTRKTIEKSQSGYDLLKNYGIPLSTWSDNYEKLERNYLIKQDLENKREIKKKKNSKKRTKPKYPYSITKLGIFLLLDYLLKNGFNILNYKKSKKNLILDLNKKDIDSFYEFIPLIWGNFKKMQNEFESKSKLKGLLEGVLENSMRRLRVEKIGNSLVQFMEIYPEKNSLNSISLSNKIDIGIDDYDLQNNTIFERLTFLFYYNLYRLIKGDMDVLGSVFYGRPISSFTTSEITAETLNFHPEPDFIKRFPTQYGKIFELVKKKETTLINLIEEDNALQQIMQNTFQEINEMNNSENLLKEAQSVFHQL